VLRARRLVLVLAGFSNKAAELSGATPSVMGDEASHEHAALRIRWASRALNAAAVELGALGALGAVQVIAEEADRVEVLAAEVAELAKAQAA
jgi:hypothetical protein